MVGDKIEDWFHLYEKDVTNFLIYYTGSIDVEDLVQDTFIIAIQKISQYKKHSHPKNWLISIARNIVIDKFRRKKVWERIKNILTRQQVDSNVLEDRLVADYENMQLYQAISKLSSPNKEIIILRGISELSSKEVSEIVKTNVNHVNVTYHRSLKMLKVLLEEEGYIYERE